MSHKRSARPGPPAQQLGNTHRRTYPPRRTPPTAAQPPPTALPSTELWPMELWLTTGHGQTPSTQRKLLTNERTFTPPIPLRRTSAAGQQAQAPPPPTQDHQPMTNPNITPTGTLQHKVAVATTPAAPKTDHRHITHTRNSTRRRFRPRMRTRIAWRHAQARPPTQDHQPMTTPNITPTGTLQHKVAVATTPAAPKTDHRHITHTRNSTRRRFRPRMRTRIAWRYAQARPSRPHHQQSPHHQPQLLTQPHRPSPQSTT